MAVVGGGIAGASFARQFLLLAAQTGADARVVLLDGPNCNYCGGLLTSRAEGTLASLYGVGLPPERILSPVTHCWYVNRAGAARVALVRPAASVLRTARFGEAGLDCLLRSRITAGLPQPVAARLRIIEPVHVLQVSPPDSALGVPARVVYAPPSSGGRPTGSTPSAGEVEADFLVLATGLQGLHSRLLQDFARRAGFCPPPVMEAGVAELEVGPVLPDRLAEAIAILDNILPGVVVGLIPKRGGWVTLTSLGRAVTPLEVTALFGHPQVHRLFNLPPGGPRFRCGRVCRTVAATGPAPRFWGDGWLAVGDLTGCGRPLKDGYSSAMESACLGARAVLDGSRDAASLWRSYALPLLRRRRDNAAGIALFELNRHLATRPWYARLIAGAAIWESRRRPSGGPIHDGIRGLATGELSYRSIGARLALGAGGYLILTAGYHLLGLARGRSFDPPSGKKGKT